MGALAIDLYLPALPGLSRELHAGEPVVQLTLTAFLVGIGSGQLLAGSLSDSLGRRRPLLVGLAVYVVASGLCAVSGSAAVLVTSRLLQGFGAAAAVVIARAIVRDVYAGARAARMFSLLMLVIGVSPILAPLVGGQLLRVTSWHGMFWALAGLGLLVLVAAAVGLPETLPDARRKAGGLLESIRTFGRLLADRRFSGYVVTFGSAFAATFAYLSASPFVFQGIYHVSPQMYGVLFGINGVGLIAASQINAAAVGRIALGRLLALGLGVRVLGAFALVGVVLIGGLGLVGIMVPLVLVVASNGLVAPNTTALALSRHPEAAGAASAVLGVVQFGVGALVAPLVGLGGAQSALPMTIVLAGGAAVGVLSLLLIVGSRPAWLGQRWGLRRID